MKTINYEKLLEGKRAVVSDGDSAVGRAVVRLFAEHGAAVAFGACDWTRAQALLGEIGGISPESFAHPADLADKESVEAFCAEVSERWPLVHVLVNNPFCFKEQSLEHTADEDDDRLLQVYQHSAVQTLRAFWPAMIKAGGCSVVNISSVTVHKPAPGMLMHATANGALGGMTRVPAVEGGIHEVRVNEIYTDYRANGDDAQGVANAALFFASDMASYVSGVSLSTGGNLARLGHSQKA